MVCSNEYTFAFNGRETALTFPERYKLPEVLSSWGLLELGVTGTCFAVRGQKMTSVSGSRMSFPAGDKDRQAHELKIFHDVAKALTSSLDLDTILQTIMEKMAAYFEPATWSLVMIDESSQEPYYAAAVGNGSEGFSTLRLRDGTTLTEWVIAHGEPLAIENVNADPL